MNTLQQISTSLRNSAAVVVICVLAVLVVVAQAERRKEAQKLKNPVSVDAASLAEGKQLYTRYCAACHGPGAKGDGSMALSGGTPSDLTDEKWDHGSTDGEIFIVIRDGTSSDMEAYKDKLSEKQIWQIVNFVRSLGPKQSK